MTIAALARSRLAMGSSARTRTGACARTLAMATRCCSPPESVSARCQVGSGGPRARGSAGRSRALPRSNRRPSAAQRRQPRRCPRRPTSTLSRTRSRFTRLNCWKTMPTRVSVSVDLGAAQHREIPLADGDGPLGDGDGPGQAAEQGGLARSRSADHGHELTGLDGDGDPIQRDPSGVALARGLDHDPGEGDAGILEIVNRRGCAAMTGASRFRVGPERRGRPSEVRCRIGPMRHRSAAASGRENALWLFPCHVARCTSV